MYNIPPAAAASRISTAERSINGALLIALLGSCAVPPRTVATAAISAPLRALPMSAPEAACNEFLRLRDAEAGNTLPVAGQLQIEAAQEHYRRAASFGFSGGLRLLQHGAVRLSTTSGFADHSRRIPMGEETVFNIGSVTKQFTAAAILKMEELGRLRTSDPINKFLPDVPAEKAGITIHQLLSHQGGFKHSMADLARTPERDAAVREMLTAELKHPPGTAFSYSNVGYALLAAIVDRLSERGYEAFLREQLWLPLGIAKTGMVLPDWREAQIADGLEFSGTTSAKVPEEWSDTGTTWFTRGAGGMDSTMIELTRWAEALRTGGMLSDASRRKLFWPHVRMNTKRILYYGYGWSLEQEKDGSCIIGHNGGGGVHYDVLSIVPQQKAVVATFNTQQKTPWSFNSNFVESLNPVLTGASLIFPEIGSSPADARHAGVYELKSGERFRVIAEGGSLKIPSDSVAALRVFAPWQVITQAPIAQFEDPGAIVGPIFEGINRGEYGKLIERLSPESTAKAENDFWSGYWPQLTQRMGPYRGADVVGTFMRGDRLRTLVRLRFEKSSTVVALVHSPGGKMFIDVIPSSFYPEVYLAPGRGHEYVSFYPTTQRTISVRFEGNDVRISSEGTSIAGRRAVAP